MTSSGRGSHLTGIRAGTRDALRLAVNDCNKIVPILGAGISIPIGLPSWDVLVRRLAESSGMAAPAGDCASGLLEIHQRMGEAAFVKAIQHELSLPGDATTLTLQALVQATPPFIITTNLDHAIENAFRLAQQPLPAYSVLCGTREELSLFGTRFAEPQLLKLHGSLERPWTWVMTSDQYDVMYAESSVVQELFRHRTGVPLFIGFSLTDADVQLCLRMARTWKIHSYAALTVEETSARQAELARFGVIPIPFDSFDQLPEILDEILGCHPVRAEIIISYGGQPSRLVVGATSVDVPNALGITGALPISPAGDKLISVLRNAVDGRPMHSLVDGRARRDSGQKGNYLNEIVSLVEDPDGTSAILLETAVRALLKYQDLFFGALLPHVLNEAKRGCFKFLSIAYEYLDQRSRPRLEQFLLNSLSNAVLAPKRIRDIAKQLALRGTHPALKLPPAVVYVDGLFVCKYLLTRYQVGQLLSDQGLIAEQSVRPYTLRDWDETLTILTRLCETTRRRWRLPRKEEWFACARLRPDAWPWGADPLRYGTHAHMNFIGRSPAEGTIEVGCFPRGASPEGLFDLIGNVYELLDAFASERLAGGAWTTDVQDEIPCHRFRVFRRVGAGRGNVGLRPVYEE